jgi:stage II sporulation protein P
LRAALWVGIVACLLVSTLFVTGRGKESSITVSAVKLSAGEAADHAAETGNIFTDSVIDPRLILGTEMPVIYGLDLNEVGPKESSDSSVPPEINFDVIPEEIMMEILRFSGDARPEYAVGAQGPQILIYHTHTQEAYRPTEEDAYVESGSWRTHDEDHSVVAVGEILKKELERRGFTVIHDTTDHEPPKLSTSYSRSLLTMLEYQQRYPTLHVFIDLHRDASSDAEDYVIIGGEECARMMFVVGTGENYKGDEKPNYESNFKLAQALTDEMNAICGGIMRPIRVKPGRYNQQVSDMCLLIEIGHNANTLEQAKNAVRYFAKALSRVVDIGSS